MNADRGGVAPPPSDDPLLLDRQICFPLYAASNLLTRIYRPVLAEVGLTYPQYLAMLVLWETEPLSVGELGERLYLDSGTLTPLLKRLAEAGFVERRRDAADERRVLITLTPQGKALRERARHVPETLLSGLELPPGDLDGLRQTVRTLVSLLQKNLGH